MGNYKKQHLGIKKELLKITNMIVEIINNPIEDKDEIFSQNIEYIDTENKKKSVRLENQTR